MSEGPLWLLWDAFRARRQGPAAIALRQRARLAEMVAYARANSPYYRELYEGLPERVEEHRALPVTNKKELMAHFDDWITDPDVTIEEVRAFISDPDRIGEQFLGKYIVATTTGTTGTPGVFIFEDRHLAAGSATLPLTFWTWLGFGGFLKLLGRGVRIAGLFATGGHFVAVVGTARARRAAPRLARRIRDFPVDMPMPEMVAGLNSFRPTMIIGYATVIQQLAREQEAGRLRIKPVLIIASAEGLAPEEYDRISKAFDAKVGNLYGSTELGDAAFSCTEGWLHVNADWVVLEPVDADYRPVPPGERSHTVLVSNLANRVQPILRYDLGDSVLQRPDPCPCGNPLPAIRVRGRSADVLQFPSSDGRVVIPPLAFASLADRTAGIELFQIVQTAPTTLRVRFNAAEGAERSRVWQELHTHMRRLLDKNRLDDVTLELAEEPPQRSLGGKHRAVIPAEDESH